MLNRHHHQHHHHPLRLVDPRHLPQLMTLEGVEPTVVAATLATRNATPPAAALQQQHSFPWVVTVLAGVLITTIVVDVIGNLLVIVSVFRNRKLRKAGRRRHIVIITGVTALPICIYIK